MSGSLQNKAPMWNQDLQWDPVKISKEILKLDLIGCIFFKDYISKI